MRAFSTQITMAKKSPELHRPRLAVPRNEAKRRIEAQIEKAKSVPNESVIENHEAEQWYKFTAELLRQLFTTDELSNEFVGRGSFSFGADDIRTTASIQIWCHDMATNPKNRSSRQMTPSDDWQEISMLYTCTQTPHLRIHLLYFPGDGEIHVDKVTVERLYT